MRIGVLSDTHGLLRDRVLELLADCDHLLHAGDVGDPAILERLGRIATTEAIRGNVDTRPPLTALPDIYRGTFNSSHLWMLHRREDAEALASREAPPNVVIFGHSHRPELFWRAGTLWLNPGACGPRRFRLPLTIARLTLDGDQRTPEILAVEP